MTILSNIPSALRCGCLFFKAMTLTRLWMFLISITRVWKSFPAWTADIPPPLPIKSQCLMMCTPIWKWGAILPKRSPPLLFLLTQMIFWLIILAIIPSWLRLYVSLFSLHPPGLWVHLQMPLGNIHWELYQLVWSHSGSLHRRNPCSLYHSLSYVLYSSSLMGLEMEERPPEEPQNPVCSTSSNSFIPLDKNCS